MSMALFMGSRVSMGERLLFDQEATPEEFHELRLIDVVVFGYC
jgi:hypothetical protein